MRCFQWKQMLKSQKSGRSPMMTHDEHVTKPWTPDINVMCLYILYLVYIYIYTYWITIHIWIQNDTKGISIDQWMLINRYTWIYYLCVWWIPKSILYVACSSLGICPDAAEVHGFYEGNHRLLDKFYDELELLRNRSNHTSLAQQKVEPAKVRVRKDLEPGDTWGDRRFIFSK